jgi:hypothetical protein
MLEQKVGELVLDLDILREATKGRTMRKRDRRAVDVERGEDPLAVASENASSAGRPSTSCTPRAGIAQDDA